MFSLMDGVLGNISFGKLFVLLLVNLYFTIRVIKATKSIVFCWVFGLASLYVTVNILYHMEIF